MVWRLLSGPQPDMQILSGETFTFEFFSFKTTLLSSPFQVPLPLVAVTKFYQVPEDTLGLRSAVYVHCDPSQPGQCCIFYNYHNIVPRNYCENIDRSVVT